MLTNGSKYFFINSNSFLYLSGSVPTGNRIPLGSSSATETSVRDCLRSREQGAKERTRGGETPRHGGKLVLPPWA